MASDEPVYPSEEHVKLVCLIGQRSLCCRYLTMHPGGWSCEKHAELRALLDSRVEQGTITARGDNCEGRSSR